MSNVPNAPRTPTPYPRRLGVAPVDPLNDPLTNPADLWMLFGRYMMSLVLMLLTIVFMFSPDPTHRIFAVPFGTVAFILQFATIKLWRRLRDERISAKEARAAARAALAVASEGQSPP